jgi:hypothetical protein
MTPNSVFWRFLAAGGWQTASLGLDKIRIQRRMPQPDHSKLRICHEYFDVSADFPRDIQRLWCKSALGSQIRPRMTL